MEDCGMSDRIHISTLALLVAVLGLCVSLGPADEERTLQKLGVGEQVMRTKIGRLEPDLTVSQWIDYGGQRQDVEWLLVFDCFEPDVGDLLCPNGDDGEPIGLGTCGAGEPDDCDGMRWYFGTTYCNVYATNDMQFDAAYGGGYAERIEAAWWWYVNGSGSGENMALLVEFYEDFDNTCAEGDPGNPGFHDNPNDPGWLGGVVINFGYTDGNPGHYYYGDIDLYGLDCLPLPADGAGSYNIWLLTYEGDDPVFPDDYSLATCGQPMLWGTGDAEYPVQDDVGRGEMSHQGVIQWDDDDPVDGWHEAPQECYDYSYRVCPDPLGATFCFWVTLGCAGDLDGDRDTDEDDLTILLNDWGCTPRCRDCVGDCDGDGDTDHSDLGILLADWGCGT